MVALFFGTDLDFLLDSPLFVMLIMALPLSTETGVALDLREEVDFLALEERAAAAELDLLFFLLSTFFLGDP